MSRDRTLAWSIRLLTAAGLAVDAGIHLYLAPTQPPAVAGSWSQVDLFYVEAGVSLLAAVLVLATGARLAYAFAFLVAASALGAVVLSRYVDIGPIGPIPDLYEPFWYTSKVATTIAEAVAVVTAAVGTLRPRRSRSHELR
ncbi:MAG: hypothetical protein ABI181_09130 [Mycobacteriaceae bacterium]